MLGRQVYLGCDIREREILVTALTHRRKKWELVNAQSLRCGGPFIEGADDVHLDLLSEGLIQLREKISRRVKGVHLSIPTSYVFLRHLQHFPNVSEADLRRLLQFEVGQSIHLPFEDPFYDLVKLGHLSGGLLVASSKPFLERLVSGWEAAGYYVLSIDVSGLALQRLLHLLHPEWLQETELILDLRSSSADIHIFHQGVLFLSRHIELAEAETETPRLQSSSGSSLTVREAEQAIDEAAASFPLREEPTDLLPRLIREIERSRSFFQYTLLKQEQPFRRLILTGQYTEELRKQLSDGLSMSIEQIQFKPLLRNELNSRYMDRYSVALGVGLRGKRRPLNKTYKG